VITPKSIFYQNIKIADNSTKEQTTSSRTIQIVGFENPCIIQLMLSKQHIYQIQNDRLVLLKYLLHMAQEAAN